MNLTLGGLSITIKSGALIPVLLMIPNVLWILFPPVDAGKNVPEPLLLTIIERVGLFAVLAIPLFLSLDLQKKFSAPMLIGMGPALVIYYACWLRYFTGGRSAELLGAPFLGFPLPMAVFPVLFLILSSYLMGSGWMLGASIIYGIAHIRISKRTL